MKDHISTGPTGVSIPSSAAEVTQEWLESVLCQSGEAIADFSLVPLDGNAGVVGSMGRLTLTYDGDVVDKPRQMMVKLASTDPMVAKTSARMGLYSTEVGFYRHAAENSPVNPPLCYHADINRRGDQFVLLLEALEGYDFAKWEAGCTLAEAETVVAALGRFHALHWGGEHLLGHRWLARPPVLARRVGGTVARGVPTCREIFPDTLPASFWEQVDQALPAFQLHLTEFSACNLTLNHGDCHLNNMIVTGDTVRLFDWQTCAINNFAYDLTYFLNGNLAEGVCSQHIERLIDCYHTALTAEGRCPLTRAEVMAEYLKATGIVSIVGLGIAGAFLSNSKMGQRIAGVLLPRIAEAALETNALRSLRS